MDRSFPRQVIPVVSRRSNPRSLPQQGTLPRMLLLLVLLFLLKGLPGQLEAAPGNPGEASRASDANGGTERHAPGNDDEAVDGDGAMMAPALEMAPDDQPAGDDLDDADLNTADEDFFEQRIRPALVRHCYACHSGSSEPPKGGLRVDTRSGLRDGGDRGPAIVPGHPDQSLLMQALRHEDLQMPPKEKLSDDTIADFETWIRGGAPDPRGNPPRVSNEASTTQATQGHWAFQAFTAQELPSIETRDWPWQRLDYFILKELEDRTLSPQVDASPAALLRRLSLDLTGLPPSVEQTRAFLANPTRAAYTRLVDQYLASPEFGRRWGRHWLDAARYADTMGQTRNVPLGHAWRYRNHVIDTLNDDLPHDQFIREQLAGDLLGGDSPDQLARRRVATGFLAIGSHDLNERNPAAYAMQVVAEQIDTVTRSMLGLTLACARCHDHKFDPLTMDDYYGLAGIFLSTDLRNGYSNNLRAGDQQERGDLLLPLRPSRTSTQPASTPRASSPRNPNLPPEAALQLRTLRRQLATLRSERSRVQESDQIPPDRQKARLRRLDAQIQQRQQEVREFVADAKRQRVTLGAAEMPSQDSTDAACAGVVDAARIRDCRINLAGEPQDLGERVPRSFPKVLSIQGAAMPTLAHSGRRELADWIVHPAHPLTARVFVNRVWSHLFGRGIVESLDNFGVTGSSPSHPELLDDLARHFADSGWSTKLLVRQLVLSHAYALSSTTGSEQQARDPDNRWLWRMNRKRLEFEVIRDTMLAGSEQLAFDSPAATLPANNSPRPRRRSPQQVPDATAFPYRSVFLPVMRNRIPAPMTAFTFPASTETQGQREVTTSPTQALFFLNDPLVLQCSEAMARRLGDLNLDRSQRIDQVYLVLLGRFPDATEFVRASQFLAAASSDTPEDRDLSNARRPDQPLENTSELRWARWIQTIMASAEFRYAL